MSVGAGLEGRQLGRSRLFHLESPPNISRGYQWRHQKTSKDWLKIDVNGELVLRHVNLLIQKTTPDDDYFLNVEETCLLSSHCNPNRTVQIVYQEECVKWKQLFALPASLTRGGRFVHITASVNTCTVNNEDYNFYKIQ